MPREDMDFTKDRQERERTDIPIKDFQRLLEEVVRSLPNYKGNPWPTLCEYRSSFTSKQDRLTPDEMANDECANRRNATRESESVFIVKITPEQQAAVRALF